MLEETSVGKCRPEDTAEDIGFLVWHYHQPDVACRDKRIYISTEFLVGNELMETGRRIIGHKKRLEVMQLGPHGFIDLLAYRDKIHTADRVIKRLHEGTERHHIVLVERTEHHKLLDLLKALPLIIRRQSQHWHPA